MADRFPSPFEMPTPPGAEGWQDLYAYSSVFSEDRREYEESAFWFMDGVHSPEAIPPWDATIVEYALIALSQYNTRHYVIPPARGVDIRFLNGYMYLSPVGVADPKEIEARIPEFAERAGYYFANWDRLYAAWLPKVRALIDELETVSFSPLPDREDMAVITEGRGTGSALDLLSTYHRLVDLTLKLWQHHFEFLNLGYAAYLDFFGCCKQLFPSIPDQAIAKMVAGIEVDLFQPWYPGALDRVCRNGERERVARLVEIRIGGGDQGIRRHAQRAVRVRQRGDVQIRLAVHEHVRRAGNDVAGLRIGEIADRHVHLDRTGVREGVDLKALELVAGRRYLQRLLRADRRIRTYLHQRPRDPRTGHAGGREFRAGLGEKCPIQRIAVAQSGARTDITAGLGGRRVRRCANDCEEEQGEYAMTARTHDGFAVHAHTSPPPPLRITSRGTVGALLPSAPSFPVRNQGRASVVAVASGGGRPSSFAGLILYMRSISRSVTPCARNPRAVSTRQSVG